jgi:poly-gamma-glutamate synthesis protein (capsule biosynthesis protein)
VHWGVPPQWQSAFQGPLAEYQEALAPRLLAAGADLVLGHHAHTVYGVEAAGSRLVCYSLGNYIFHPLASPRPLPLDAPSRPYQAHERPENRDTFIGRFTVSATPDGLRLSEARLSPGVLDESWEARASSPDSALRIAQRLHAFSAWRNTPTRIDGSALVWEPST